MTDDRRPLRVGAVTVTGRDSEPVLVGGAQPLRLNETALAIWDLCDGATTVDEMVEAVVELGLDEGRVRADIRGVVDELERLGVVTETAGGITPSNTQAHTGG